MVNTAKTILDEALKLPANDRAALVAGWMGSGLTFDISDMHCVLKGTDGWGQVLHFTSGLMAGMRWMGSGLRYRWMGSGLTFYIWFNGRHEMDGVRSYI